MTRNFLGTRLFAQRCSDQQNLHWHHNDGANARGIVLAAIFALALGGMVFSGSCSPDLPQTRRTRMLSSSSLVVLAIASGLMVRRPHAIGSQTAGRGGFG